MREMKAQRLGPQPSPRHSASAGRGEPIGCRTISPCAAAVVLECAWVEVRDQPRRPIWPLARRRYTRRLQNWLGDWSRSRPRRRHRDSVKDVLLDCLELIGEVARHPVLADSELVNAPRHLVLAHGQASNHPVDALPHGVDIQRHRDELLVIGRRDGWRDHLSGRTAVGLQSQSCRNTNEKCDQIASKGERAYVVEAWRSSPICSSRRRA
jgi:hypothetical protein